MKNQNVFIILLLVLILPALIFASGTNEGTAETRESEIKELNIAIFEGGYGPEYWNEIVNAYETARPDVKINMQISPKIGDIIRPQIVAGNVPDFISMNDNDQSGLLAAMIKEKTLMDITDSFDQKAWNSDEALKDQILDGILKSAKSSPYGDGRIFLAPFNSSPMGLVYNKTLFEKNGWSLPETWDEFFSLGDKAKEQGISLFTYAGIYPGYIESFLFPAIASVIGLDGFDKIMNYEDSAFDNDAVKSVLENIQKIASGGYLLSGTVALNHTQSQTDMMNDKALFIPNGVWIENEMADAPRSEGFKFSMIPAPVINKGDTQYIMTSVEQFSIPAKAKNPELTKDFLRFLYSEESIKLFAEKANGIYAIKGANELVKGIVSDGVYNMFNAYNDAFSMVVGWSALPKGSRVAVNDEMFNPVSDIMNQNMSTDEWADSIESAFAQIRADRK